MPTLARTPLSPVVFGEVTHPDSTVAKVYFESLPGFFVTGNLYRLGGSGPFPAILSPHGHWAYGLFVANRGRFDEGLAELKQARELDPLSLPISIDVGWVCYLSRRYPEAKEHLRKALENDPNNPEAIVYLGRTYLATKEFSQAIALLEKASDKDETQWILAMLGYARAVSGRGDEARQRASRDEQQLVDLV